MSNSYISTWFPCLWLVKRPHVIMHKYPVTALPIINICRYLVPFLEIGMIVLINVNPTFLKLIILSRFILMEKYDNISEKVMLKNSKCVINICCYAPRRYVHAQRTPLFWMVHSKQVADFTGTFKCGKWQYKWWFFVYFWKIKGMNLQNNGVWRMVHHKLMYERGSWMGLSAWTFFMPSGCALSSGINNRSCTQSHSWTPNSYISTWFPCLWLVKRPHVTMYKYRS